MKLFVKFPFIILLIILVACGEDFSDDRAASEMQFDEYITEAGIDTSYRLESGVYFIPRVEGEGKMPEPGDEIVIQYRAYTLDSTYIQDNESTTPKQEFTLNGTIMNNQTIPYGMEGLHEGLALMKEGGEATMIIPFELAFAHYQVNNLPRFMNYRLEVKLINIKETLFE